MTQTYGPYTKPNPKPFTTPPPTIEEYKRIRQTLRDWATQADTWSATLTGTPDSVFAAALCDTLRRIDSDLQHNTFTFEEFAKETKQ